MCDRSARWGTAHAPPAGKLSGRLNNPYPGFRVLLNETRPLADFQQNAKRHLRCLSKTGQPEVLTVNGKPAVVVQDARSYRRLLDAVEQAEAIAGIKLGLENLAQGEGQPAQAAAVKGRTTRTTQDR